MACRSEGSVPVGSRCCNSASLGTTAFYFQHILSTNSSACVTQEDRLSLLTVKSMNTNEVFTGI